jgi:O-antigen/teichoic acid export membrane protein
MMACTAVALALNVSWLARRTGGSARVEGAVLARAARRTHISSVGPIDGLALDRTLVGSLLGSVGLGLYSAATAVAGLLTILGGAIAMVILPRLVRVQGDPDAERTMVRTTIAFSAAVIAAVTAAIVVVAGTVIRIAFGADFVPATRTAEWLVGASGLLAFRRVLIAVLQARGRGGLASVIETVLTPVLVVGIVVASLHDDLVGVALTMGVVGLLSCLALGTAVARTKPLAPPEPLEHE